jgi:hypothetical protein
MIATQRIDSTTSVPKSLEGFEVVNVLKWKYLETDGKEICSNPGGILFENFYQGCKVYDIVYKNKVYASRFQHGDDKFLYAYR